MGAEAQYAPGVAAHALSTVPDRRAFAAAYAAEGQQMDNLCGCFWASLALRAAGIDADQEAVALAAGSILPGGDPQTHVAPGATPRCDYRVELPLADVPATAGTAAPPLAAAIEHLSDGRLAAIEVAGPWTADHVCTLLDTAAGSVLIANVRTGPFWGSRPDPAVVARAPRRRQPRAAAVRLGRRPLRRARRPRARARAARSWSCATPIASWAETATTCSRPSGSRRPCGATTAPRAACSSCARPRPPTGCAGR